MIPTEKILFDIDQPIKEQFTEQFFLALKLRLVQEHQVEQFQAFSERVYESGFRDTIARKADEMQDFVDEQMASGKANFLSINREAILIFEDILDYFIIRFCPDLTETALPETILKHQYSNTKKSPLKTLIFDYLDLESERERFYRDFVELPSHKLQNATEAFLKAARDEEVFFICDTSLLANGKTGFAMTDRSIYWKPPFQKAHFVNYQSLETISREREWIKINDAFFNVNPSLNLKLLKLLKKIKHSF